MDDETFSKQYDAALAAGRNSGPRAVAAHFDEKERRIWVELDNGTQLGFPVDVVEGLRTAPTEALRDVEVLPRGVGLSWEALDVDLSIAGILASSFGTRAWMSEIGRLGGSTRTEAKARAARDNGRKGGRPRSNPKASAGPDTNPAVIWTDPSTAGGPAIAGEDLDARVWRPFDPNTNPARTPRSRTPARVA
jgi:hypothetical protein